MSNTRLDKAGLSTLWGLINDAISGKATTDGKVYAAALNAIVAACGLTTEGLYEASSELLDGTTSLRQALDIVAEYVTSLETKVTELEERITALEG